MASFLLGGRAWTVERVSHADRVVVVRDAPGGKKPSWGGFIPQHLGFDLCQRMKRVLTDDVRATPTSTRPGSKQIEQKREELGELLRRPGHAVQIDGGVGALVDVRRGAREPHPQVRLRGRRGVEGGRRQLPAPHRGRRRGPRERAAGDRQDGVTPRSGTRPTLRRAVLARLPGYRLSKFQDCLPERFALEVIETLPPRRGGDGEVAWRR